MNQNKIKACCDINHVLSPTDVTVKNVVFKSVEQTESKVLVATIVGDGSKVTAKDVVITNTDNKVVNPVKKVSVDSKDKTKLVIEAYNSMTDGKTYSVKYDDKELTFVASDGKVNDLTVDPVVINENTLTEINLVPVDVNGVKLDKIAFSTAAGKYEFNIDVTKGTGYTSGKQLLLSKAGDEATATVKYTPGTVDVNGAQTGVIGPKKIVITAQTPEAITVGNFKMAIGDKTKKFADAKVDATLAKGDTTKAAFFEIKNSKDKEISGDEYLTYTVESSDTNVLILGSSKLGSKHEVSLVPVAEGTAYIVLKDKDGNVKGTFPVTVSAESKIASLTLDKSSATVYTGTALNTVDVALTVKDQYTNKVTIAKANVDVKCVSVADGGDKNAANTNTADAYFEIAADGSKVTFKAAGSVVAGTYTYTIKVSKDNVNLQQNVTIKIVPAKTSGTKTDYELAFSDNTVDVAFDKKAATINTAKNVTIQVIKKIDGVPSEVVSAASIKVTKPDGTSKTISSDTTTGLVQFDNEAKTNTFAAIEVNSTVATQAAIGTYKFEVVPAGASTVTLTRSLTITNSSTDKLTAVPVATTVNKTDASISDIEDLLTKNIRYTYAGKNYEGSGSPANGADYAVTVTGFKVILSDGTTKELKVDGTPSSGSLSDSLTNISSVSIQNVTIQVTLKNEAETSTVMFNQTVNIGQTITLQ